MQLISHAVRHQLEALRKPQCWGARQDRNRKQDMSIEQKLTSLLKALFLASR